MAALALGAPAWASDDAITATIEAWPHDRAEFATGLIEPRVIGRVNADGTVHIPLPPDFTQTTIETTEAQNAGDSGWSITMKTAGEARGCESDGLEVKNGDQYEVNLSSMGAFMIGYMEEAWMLTL
jgi:hypothetical protein